MMTLEVFVAVLITRAGGESEQEGSGGSGRGDSWAPLRMVEVVELAQICRRSDSSVEEAVAAVVARRPMVETKHLLLGAIHDGPVRAMLDDLTQGERDRLFERILAKRLQDPASAAARLGTRSFTIVSDRPAAELLGADADGIEAWVHDEVLEELSGNE